MLILSYSLVDSDPRVLRQIKFFRTSGFNVTLSAVGYQGDLPFFPLTKPKSFLFRVVKLLIMIFRLNRVREWEFLRHSSLKELGAISPAFDLIVANDAETWPVAAALQRMHPQAKTIFDAHEHYAKQFNDMWVWTWFHKRFAEYLCKKFIPTADEFLTVCDGIAKDYELDYGVKATVVLNTPDFEADLKPNQLGQKIKLVHHGIAVRSRKIEKMIRMMEFLEDRFSIDLVLVPSENGYLEELKALADGKDIKFPEPVPTLEIPAFLNQYDLGIFLLEPVNFNYEYALPNKFFEFIQGRLGIAIGPSPEMKKIVEKNKLGVVSTSFEEEDLAKYLNQLSSEEIFQMKQNSDAAAAYYSNSQNEVIFRSFLAKINLN